MYIDTILSQEEPVYGNINIPSLTNSHVVGAEESREKAEKCERINKKIEETIAIHKSMKPTVSRGISGQLSNSRSDKNGYTNKLNESLHSQLNSSNRSNNSCELINRVSSKSNRSLSLEYIDYSQLEESIKRNNALSQLNNRPQSERIFNDEEILSYKNNKSKQGSYYGRLKHMVIPDMKEIANVFQQNVDVSDNSWKDNIQCKNTCTYIYKLLKREQEPDGIKREPEHEEVCRKVPTVNARYIIPKYYFTNCKKGELLKIDFYNTIIDSIRNFRKLSDFQLEYIKTSTTDDEKYEIICLLDNTASDMFNALRTRPTTPNSTHV